MVGLSFLFLYLNVSLKDSFEFANDITNQKSNCFIASSDVDSLLTNVPPDETIKICMSSLNLK